MKPLTTAALILALPLCLAGCHRRSAVTAAPPPPPPPAESTAPAAQATPPEFAVDAVSTREGLAVWYDVPAGSLPERRAWPGELTAASDGLDLNSYVRVRRVGPGDNGKSVVVRITDRGIHHKGALIDLDREAAETLGMVDKGEARVRVETLAFKNADADKPVDRKDAPTAATITGTPAATTQQEKNSAAAKAGGATPP